MSLAIVATGQRQPSVTIDAGSYGVRVDVGARPAISITGLSTWPTDDTGRPLTLGGAPLTLGGLPLTLDP